MPKMLQHAKDPEMLYNKKNNIIAKKEGTPDKK
jgi:hypothetical protein